MDEKIIQAREFCVAVKELADKYNLPFFVVTDGASALSNNNCSAVEHARESHIRWEKEHGIDPNHDWSEDITK